MAFPGGLVGKESACNEVDSGSFTIEGRGWEDPLEKGTASVFQYTEIYWTHFSVLAWSIPWT